MEEVQRSIAGPARLKIKQDLAYAGIDIVNVQSNAVPRLSVRRDQHMACQDVA